MATPIYDTVLDEIKIWTPVVKSFYFRFPQGSVMDFRPGQFVMAHVPRDGKMVKKPYSIASPPSQKDRLELIITKVEGGYVSTFFHNLKTGDKMPIEGPLGKFFVKEPFQELIFVATGTGIAPFRSQIRSILERGATQPIWLFFGVRYEDQILYYDEMRELAAKYKNFRFIPTISRPHPGKWDGEVGYVQDKVKKYISGAAGKDIYICGIVPMVEDLKKVTEEMGFDKSQVHYEKYT